MFAGSGGCHRRKPAATVAQWGQYQHWVGQRVSTLGECVYDRLPPHEGQLAVAVPLILADPVLLGLLDRHQDSDGQCPKGFTGNDRCMCREWLAGLHPQEDHYVEDDGAGQVGHRQLPIDPPPPATPHDLPLLLTFLTCHNWSTRWERPRSSGLKWRSSRWRMSGLWSRGYQSWRSEWKCSSRRWRWAGRGMARVRLSAVPKNTFTCESIFL